MLTTTNPTKNDRQTTRRPVKSYLLHRGLRLLSDNRATPAAHALFAHVIESAQPWNESWATTATTENLADRLGLSVDEIGSLLRELILLGAAYRIRIMNPRGISVKAIAIDVQQLQQPSTRGPMLAAGDTAEIIEARGALIGNRPDWLAPGEPWVYPSTTAWMAQRPISLEAIRAALEETRDKSTAQSPAAFFVSRLKAAAEEVGA